MPRFLGSEALPVADIEHSLEKQRVFGFRDSTAFWALANANVAMLVASAMAPLNVTEGMFHKLTFRYACLTAAVVGWAIYY